MLIDYSASSSGPLSFELMTVIIRTYNRRKIGSCGAVFRA